jgi:putative endonuclease
VEEKVTKLLAWLRPRRDLGLWGERLAVRELERRGYVVLERRWRCPLGEIDIVAKEGPVLVVVEVKTRSREDFGSPINAVDGKKRRKLEKLARAYLKARRLGAASVRFDVVGVTVLPGEAPRVEIFEGALSF